MSEFKKRFLYVLAFVVALLAVGTIGFIRLGWSPSDSLFMTTITLSAVGYREVKPLGDGARLLASILLVGGLTASGPGCPTWRSSETRRACR